MWRLLLILALVSAASNAKAQGLAGEWTKCVAWHNGDQWNIVNGQYINTQCFALARKCTGNPNVRVTFYGNAVVINAPYKRCTEMLP